MPQPKKGARLGSNPSHQRLMLSNLALSLFENERIRTTEAKAKLLRPYAERLITKAKHGTIHHRRQVLSTIENREIVHKLFAEIAPRFADRNGGYTRIMKLGPRNGDGAEMALIELVDAGAQRGAEVVDTSAETEGRRRRLRRRKTETVSDLPQDKPMRSRAAEAAAAGGTAAGKTELDTSEVAEVGKEEEAEAASLDDDDAAGAEQAGVGETAEDPAAPPDDAPTTGGDAGAR